MYVLLGPDMNRVIQRHYRRKRAVCLPYFQLKLCVPAGRWRTDDAEPLSALLRSRAEPSAAHFRLVYIPRQAQEVLLV